MNYETEKQIKKSFEIIQKRISANNRLGMYDSARFLEDLIAKVLNRMYGWRLENQNKTRRNAPYIDLYDASNKIIVQVTTQKDNLKQKIDKTVMGTIEEYNNCELFVFSLFGYPEPMNLIAKIDKDNLFDIPKLLVRLRSCNVDIQNDVSRMLLEARDSLAFSISPKEIFDPDLSKEYSIVKSGGFTAFSHGRGRVRIAAFIPENTEEHFSCLVEFGRHTVSEAFISFDEKEAVIDILDFENVDIKKRKVIVQISEEKDWAAIQMCNTRLFVDIDTANQLCTLLDEVRDIYLQNKEIIREVIGAKNCEMETISNPRIHLSRISNDLWRHICIFADEQGDCEEHGEWGKFIPCYSSWHTKRLQLTNDFGRSIACYIEREPISDSDECNLYWVSGYAGYHVFEEGYQNGKLWGVETAREWLIEKLIPLVENRKTEHFVQKPIFFSRFFKRRRKPH